MGQRPTVLAVKNYLHRVVVQEGKDDSKIDFSRRIGRITSEEVFHSPAPLRGAMIGLNSLPWVVDPRLPILHRYAM